jgi:hypothetical protein
MGEHVDDTDFLLEQFKHHGKTRTVKQFVEGISTKDGAMAQGATGMPASRVRRTIGELYGLGLVKVDKVVDGEEYWTPTTTKDRLTL